MCGMPGGVMLGYAERRKYYRKHTCTVDFHDHMHAPKKWNIEPNKMTLSKFDNALL